MARESLKNFATSALSGAITSGSTTINLTTSSGSSFPSTGSFVIVIDTELILIASRSGDSLTVASSGRGWDGTTAAAHSSAATVQLPICAYNLNHIWANIPDTFVPDVPPVQTPLSTSGVPSGSASAYDNEFESQGSWTLFPTSLPSGATFNVGTSVKSHLVMGRGTGTDNTLYTAYVAFAPGATPWTATCKIMGGMNSINLGGQIVETHLLVSDLSNPSGTVDPGNAMRIDVPINAAVTSGAITGNRTVRPAKNVSGVFSVIAPNIVVPFSGPLYLRMNNDGAGRYQLFFSTDGLAYVLLVDQTFNFTIAS